MIGDRREGERRELEAVRLLRASIPWFVGGAPGALERNQRPTDKCLLAPCGFAYD